MLRNGVEGKDVMPYRRCLNRSSAIAIDARVVARRARY